MPPPRALKGAFRASAEGLDRGIALRDSLSAFIFNVLAPLVAEMFSSKPCSSCHQFTLDHFFDWVVAVGRIIVFQQERSSLSQGR